MDSRKRTRAVLTVLVSILLWVSRFVSMIFLVETPFFFLMADTYLMTLSFGLVGGLVYELFKNFLFYTLVVKEGAGVVLRLSICTGVTIYYTCRRSYSLSYRWFLMYFVRIQSSILLCQGCLSTIRMLWLKVCIS